MEIEFLFIKLDLLTKWKNNEKLFWEKVENILSSNIYPITTSKNIIINLKKYWYENIIKLLLIHNDLMEEIKDLLEYYLRVKYNKKLIFKEEVLKELWFNGCKKCFNSSI